MGMELNQSEFVREYTSPTGLIEVETQWGEVCDQVIGTIAELYLLTSGIWT